MKKSLIGVLRSQGFSLSSFSLSPSSCWELNFTENNKIKSLHDSRKASSPVDSQYWRRLQARSCLLLNLVWSVVKGLLILYLSMRSSFSIVWCLRITHLGIGRSSPGLGSVIGPPTHHRPSIRLLLLLLTASFRVGDLLLTSADLIVCPLSLSLSLRA